MTPALTRALVKAQAQIKPVSKNKENVGFMRGGVASRYADLAAIVDGAREALKANGLAFMQDVTTSAEGVGVSTTLLHESGEERTSKVCWMPVVNKTPQGFGSAITYARRYSFSAALGIVTDDDDDGNSASSTASRSMPKPSGTEGLRDKLPPASRPASSASPSGAGPSHNRSLEYPFGSSKGKPIHLVDDKGIAFWLDKCRSELNDSSKAKWRDATRTRIATLEAEQRFRAGMQQPDDTSRGSYEEPPPPSDSDAPF